MLDIYAASRFFLKILLLFLHLSLQKVEASYIPGRSSSVFYATSGSQLSSQILICKLKGWI